ncbi:MAG: DUF1178 family protein [Hyphomicrobiales bacterium]|nr:MAG: DUF1178 family protein [Hyphomicrobiales bacterium]|tara:strand:+ start:177 stop:602 length:426 start_codon:yes stop_codon:yes gene_type:complete
MIRYDLVCENEHFFESWFKDSKSYQKQLEANEIACPKCNNTNISKSLMAPGIPKKTNTKNGNVIANSSSSTINNAIRKIRDEIKKNSDYVGDQFPEEARKIHYNEAEMRSIYGKASKKEITELVDEGIDIIQIPEIPDDKN